MPSIPCWRKALLVQFFQRVWSLPDGHPSVQLMLEQKLECTQMTGRKRPLHRNLLAECNEIEDEYEVSHQDPPGGDSGASALQLAYSRTRHMWLEDREDTQHLRQFYRLRYDDANNLVKGDASYLKYDSPRTAAHRARLRFNLARLQLSMQHRHMEVESGVLYASFV